MLAREAALRVALREARHHVHEVGGNNRGPRVEQYQRHDDLPGEGYPWCLDLWQFAYDEIGNPLFSKTAGVMLFHAKARKHDLIVDRPLRGDLCVVDFDGDGTFDHIFGVVRVLAFQGPFVRLRTVEGNTSPQPGSGSQADGDGVYVKVRSVRRANVAFIRPKGNAKKPPHLDADGKLHVEPQEPKRKPRRVEKTIRRGAKGAPVGKAQTLLNRHGAGLRVDREFGPATEAAVREFQRKHGLGADGIVGPHTWAKLKTKENA